MVGQLEQLRPARSGHRSSSSFIRHFPQFSAKRVPGYYHKEIESMGGENVAGEQK